MVIANELQYEIKETKAVHYKYQNVPTELGTGSIPQLQAAGGDITRFNLPVSVFNLSRSYIEFVITPGAGANTISNWFHLDGFPFWNRIRLITRSGVVIYDNSALHYYLNMTSRRNQKIEDVQTWGKPKRSGGTSNVTAVYTGQYNGLTCNNELAYVVTNNASGNPNATSSLSATALSARADGSVVQTPFLEPAYFCSGGSASASPVLNVKLQLDFIKDSIFAVDKDLYFGGEIVTIECYWAPWTAFIFQTAASLTNPTTGAQVYTTTGNIVVTNLALKLAIEDDAENASHIINMVKNGGLQVIAPWVTYNQVNLTGNQTHSVSIILNPSMGKKLKRVYWAPYSSGPTPSFRWYHANCDNTGVSGFRIQNYFTTLDEQQLQYGNVNCVNDDCYMRQKELLRGSCILSDNEHFYNWVHIDDFTVGTALYARPEHLDGIYEDSFWQGYDLVKDVRYGVQATTSPTVANNGNADPSNGGDFTSENHYLFAITLKVLHITASSISLA